jgi:hypothetical protein
MLLDLKALIASLTAAGEELEILSARINVRMSSFPHETTEGSYFAHAKLAIMVSDAAIASADPALNATGGYFNAIVSSMSSGDFETHRIGDILSKAITNWQVTAGTIYGEYQGAGTFDVTALMRRISMKIVESPMLATNPEICLIAGIVTEGGESSFPQFKGTLDMKVRRVSRTNRML